MPPSRCGWTQPRSKRRDGGWGGGWMARTNPVSRCRLHQRCWPSAVHSWWRGVWGGSQGACGRYGPWMGNEMTLPQG